MGSRVDRAKQFLPFDALKGLQEALREKEIEYEEKRIFYQDIIYSKMDDFLVNQIHKKL